MLRVNNERAGMSGRQGQGQGRMRIFFVFNKPGLVEEIKLLFFLLHPSLTPAVPQEKKPYDQEG